MQSIQEDLNPLPEKGGSRATNHALRSGQRKATAGIRTAPRPTRPIAGALALILFGTVAASSFAQTPTPPAGGILRDVERSLPSRQITSPEGLRIEVPDAPALSSEPDMMRVTVSRYHITGNTAFDEETLQAVIADRTGTLSLTELQQVADELALYYRERGYLLARAYLPQQEVERGEVTIAVLEGRYDEIEVDSGARLSERRVRRTLTHGMCSEPDCAGALISRGELERGLLLLNDTPGAQAAARLSPGGYTGSSTLSAEVAADRLASGYLQLDNGGSYYSGVARAIGTLWLNNPVGIGDQLTLQGVAAGRHGELYYGTLGYGIPLGYRGMRLAVKGSSLRYELGEQYEVLDAHGTVRGADVALFYPFVRSLRGNLYGSFTYGSRRFHDEAEAVGVDTRRKISNRRELGLNADFADELFGVGALNTMSVLYSDGELELDPTLAVLDAVTARSAGDYGKWMASYTRLQSLFGRTSLFLRVSGQSTSDNLDSYEKFALGGPDSVRAYPMSETLVDNAVLYSVELRQRFGNGALEGVLFHDRAYGHVNADPWDGTPTGRVKLNGTGVGVNWALTDRMMLRSTLAFRGDRPMTAAPDDDYHYNLSLNMAF